MKLKSIGKKTDRIELPLVPLRELVIFPYMVVPFFVGRKASINAVETAMSGDRRLFLACQKTASDDPNEEDIYSAGSVSKILQMLKLPDGTIRVLVEGQNRGHIRKFIQKKDSFQVNINTIQETRDITTRLSALMDTVLNTFDKLKKFHKKLTPEIITSIEKAEFPDKLADLICGNLPLKPEKKVEILGIEETEKRLEVLAVALEQELEVQSLQHRIQSKVRKRIEKSQKEYFLNEQMKEIRKELGKDEEETDELKELEKRIETRKPPPEVLEKAKRELNRLSKLQPMSPESGVLRTYLEWVADLPWSERRTDNKDIDRAAKILDEDHYDMKKPKDRILDFIAVRQLKEKMKGPILCLVGPPGTGKTSLGKSIARALDREFVRISLGGVRDEAEIRGHRKTYVGALPGKILQSMKKVGSVNPVFLLDEVDKINSDFRGDPASALLEVLDPEQNYSFMDHYLELPYDLSAVMFITTANSMYTIPYALRDRMEIIEIPGYTEYEKIKIATEFIIPKQIEENGLSGAKITFQQSALKSIIQGYTMESGVRNLEREIASVIRKVAREAVKEGFKPREEIEQSSEEPAISENVEVKTGVVEVKEPEKTFSATVTEKKVEKYLGKKRFLDDLVYRDNQPGLAHGLAWTETGGTLLPIEVAIIEGMGELILTGNLGDVMKESARTALSFIRGSYRKFNLGASFQKGVDIHIHVPEGAIPKDGPSAGITITAALISAFTGIAIAPGFAMTGEITLTGRLLPIGGIKEKVLAAHRNKMKTVLMPEPNRKDTDELPKEVKSEIEFVFADTALDALIHLFPEPFSTR
ncbi:MAG: endopeptidase La [Spirochaetales bacterium]|nr:endopeptidase La [Spirochaetales bacterium]